MAAPLGVGACIITDDDGDTENATTNPSGGPVTGNDTEAPATDTDVATTETPGDSTAGPATDSGSATTTGQDTTAGETEEPPPSICVDYAALITECYTEKEGMAILDYCGEYIQQLYDSYGAGCVTAYEDYLACLSALTCDELMGAEPICVDQETALDKACAAP